jgi:hypothetical protein
MSLRTRGIVGTLIVGLVTLGAIAVVAAHI